MKKRKRAKYVDRAMHLVWDSLQSHLPWCYSKKYPKGEDSKFHKKCVREYVAVLKNLSKLY